jgi:hypothetical protein
MTVTSATTISTSYREPSPRELASLNINTILRDIRGVSRERTGPLPGFQEWAARTFAELNGWRWAPNGWFMLEDLGKPHNNYDSLVYPWADHPLYFRAPRTDGKSGWVNRAIVGQPYHPHTEEVEHLRSLGYGVSRPPVHRASIHLPGGCYFIVVTKAPETIKFLPEQCDPRALAAWLPKTE